MTYLSISDYEKYIHNAYLSPSEHTVLARVYPDPIQGISYDGIL